ncbi:MAG: septal ring lytic transglycosylase RlpA family protein [Solirubrobacteraceae bacterium]
MSHRQCLRSARPVGALMLAIPVSAVAVPDPVQARGRIQSAPVQHRLLERATAQSRPSRPLASLAPLAPLRASLTSPSPLAPLTRRARVTRNRAHPHSQAHSGGAGIPLARRAQLARDRANASSGGAAVRQTVYTESIASWYDDTGSTACGFHARLGVANRVLPCGTRVAFRYGARTVTAVVDDRGPYVGGRVWDLNQNTAAALGFSGVDTVRASR